MIPWKLTWTTPLGELRVVDAIGRDLTEHIPTLVRAYNDPHNMRLLGHTAELTEDDVLEHYRTLWQAGDEPFLLFRDGVLVGDADVRAIGNTPGPHGREEATGEFAFLIAAPADQGKGLGTAFATMIHTRVFRHAELDRVYAAVIPENAGSRRVFEKLGYRVDTSATAKNFGDEGDVILSIDRATFLARHADAVAQIRRTLR
jgi:RimJ/RimL family protein N-acetyltransferase